VIHPDEQTLLIYTLVNGKYQASKLFTIGDFISTPILTDFVLDLEQVFAEN
jgi:Uma2 family endonuclease